MLNRKDTVCVCVCGGGGGGGGVQCSVFITNLKQEDGGQKIPCEFTCRLESLKLK